MTTAKRDTSTLNKFVDGIPETLSNVVNRRIIRSMCGEYVIERTFSGVQLSQAVATEVSRRLLLAADAASPASGGEWIVGWMARSSAQGRLFAHDEAQARERGHEAYAPHPFEVVPLIAASPSPSLTEKKIARIVCEHINRPFTDSMSCCQADVANGEKCNNKLNWGEAIEVARAVMALIRGEKESTNARS